MACRCVCLQSLAELQPVHNGHHDIADDDVGDILQGEREAALAVGSLHDVISLTENHAEIFPHISIVIHHEH